MRNHALTDRVLLVQLMLGLGALSGCASLKSIAGAIGDAGGAIGGLFEGPKVEFSRPKPAVKDLPQVKHVAIGALEGEGADKLDAMLRQRLAESGRFHVVSSDRLAELAKTGGCDTTDAACIGKSLPGFAIVSGRIKDAEYKENTEHSAVDCPDGKNKGNKCQSEVRTGKAHVALELRLRGEDGTELVERSAEKTAEKEETNLDGKAAKIDGQRLLEQARNEAADEFLTLVCPRKIKETLPLESDDDIPQLKLGVKQLELGSTSDGIRLLKIASDKADQGSDLELKAKAHYSLGVGHAADGNYAEALKEVKVAQAAHADDDWAKLIEDLQTWGSDATRYEKQVALGKEAPAAVPSAVAANTETKAPEAAPADPTSGATTEPKAPAP